MSNYSTREWVKDQAAAKAISDMGNTVSTVVAQRNQAQQQANKLEQENDDLIKHGMKWVNYAKKLEGDLAERDAQLAERKAQLAERKAQLAERKAQIADLIEKNDKFKKDGFRFLRQIREQNAKIEGLEGYENAYKRVSIVRALDNLILANVNAARSVLAESN